MWQQRVIEFEPPKGLKPWFHRTCVKRTDSLIDRSLWFQFYDPPLQTFPPPFIHYHRCIHNESEQLLQFFFAILKSALIVELANLFEERWNSWTINPRDFSDRLEQRHFRSRERFPVIWLNYRCVPVYNYANRVSIPTGPAPLYPRASTLCV